MFAKTAIAFALLVTAVSSAVAAPTYSSSGWRVGTDPSAQIRNYLQHDRGAS